MEKDRNTGKRTQETQSRTLCALPTCPSHQRSESGASRDLHKVEVTFEMVPIFLTHRTMKSGTIDI